MNSQNGIDRLIAVCVLIATLPIVAISALAVVIEDGGPAIFRQRRIGQSGKPFDLFKLRSMRTVSAGTGITARGDPRITRVGKILRKYKLDELPQIWNILRGEMAFIGPRPEVPEYVDTCDRRWRVILSVKPGLTDLASLLFCNEEQVLSQQCDIETFYRTYLLPRKLELSSQYIRTRSFTTDVKLIWLTIAHCLRPNRNPSSSIARHFDQGEAI